MIWELVICTAGWVMCGQLRVEEYQGEESCYRALDELYKRQGREDFKYVICRPKKAERAQGEG